MKSKVTLSELIDSYKEAIHKVIAKHYYFKDSMLRKELSVDINLCDKHIRFTVLSPAGNLYGFDTLKEALKKYNQY